MTTGGIETLSLLFSIKIDDTPQEYIINTMKNFPTKIHTTLITTAILFGVLIFISRALAYYGEEVVYLEDPDFSDGEDVGPPEVDNEQDERLTAILLEADKESEKDYGTPPPHLTPDGEIKFTYNDYYKIFDGVLFFSEYDYEKNTHMLTEMEGADGETFQILPYKDISNYGEDYIESGNSFFAKDKNTSYVYNIQIDGHVEPVARYIFKVNNSLYAFSHENNAVEKLDINLDEISYIDVGYFNLLKIGDSLYYDTGRSLFPVIDVSSMENEDKLLKDSQNIWKCWDRYFRETNICVHVPDIDLSQSDQKIGRDVSDYFRKIDEATDEVMWTF